MNRQFLMRNFQVQTNSHPSLWDFCHLKHHNLHFFSLQKASRVPSPRFKKRPPRDVFTKPWRVWSPQPRLKSDLVRICLFKAKVHGNIGVRWQYPIFQPFLVMGWTWWKTTISQVMFWNHHPNLQPSIRKQRLFRVPGGEKKLGTLARLQ